MAMDMAMVDMVMDTMDTMARDPLMLRVSPDMATMVMDMDMVMAMDTAMVDMDMDTMVTTARDLLMLGHRCCRARVWILWPWIWTSWIWLWTWIWLWRIWIWTPWILWQEIC